MAPPTGGIPWWPTLTRPCPQGVGQGEAGRGHFRLKCGFQDGGGLWRMAMTAAFVLALLPLGPRAVNDAAPGKVPLTFCSPARTEKRSRRGAKGG